MLTGVSAADPSTFASAATFRTLGSCAGQLPAGATGHARESHCGTSSDRVIGFVGPMLAPSAALIGHLANNLEPGPNGVLGSSERIVGDPEVRHERRCARGLGGQAVAVAKSPSHQQRAQEAPLRAGDQPGFGRVTKYSETATSPSPESGPSFAKCLHSANSGFKDSKKIQPRNSAKLLIWRRERDSEP